ncbi:MAG: glycosyltransferase family 2 protein [Gemmatimonadaceae bacterium]
MEMELSKDRLSPDVEEPAIELSIVLPCLNEAETLATCIRKANDGIRANGIMGEVVVADNGSTDGSQQIARDLGARVVHVPVRGYGAALQWGIDAARGRYIIMADSDDSYDLSGIAPFVERLRAGDELVMGNRFRGGIKPGAMPPLHRYLGNPVLSGLGRLFFNTPAKDFHCGMRGFTKEAAQRLDLRTTGMEFASEMVVKATIARMRVSEVPTTLSPDGRSRPPHLRSWRDGWRHLRFLLLYSPRFLFLLPGVLLIGVGLGVGAWLLSGPGNIGSVSLNVNTLLFCSTAILLGTQAVLFWIFSKVFGMTEGLLPVDERLESLFKYVTLEVGAAVGAAVFILGLVLAAYATIRWSESGFGPLDVSRSMRIVIPATLFMLLGAEGIMASFFLSILGLKRKA